jgi:drug/metabolite transporter (DMT)-like permease
MEPTLRPLPIALLIAAALVYPLVFTFNRIAADAGAGFAGHAFWQTFLAGLALMIVAALQGDRVTFGWAYLRAYVVVGALGFGLPMALLTFVAPELPTSVVSLVLALSPTFTYLASVVFRLDRLALLGIVGILLGFAGVAVILAPDEALPGADAAGWFALALLTPVMLAICNVSAALLRPPEATSTVMGSGFLLGAALVIAPLALIFEAAGVGAGHIYLPTSGDALLAALGGGAVNAVFIVLFAVIVSRYGPTFFAQFNYLAVVSAIGWGFVIFGEQPNIYVLIALGLMTAGVVISELRHPRLPVD